MVAGADDRTAGLRTKDAGTNQEHAVSNQLPSSMILDLVWNVVSYTVYIPTRLVRRVFPEFTTKNRTIQK